MNARVELPQAREVCPTTTRRLIAEERAQVVDAREPSKSSRSPGRVRVALSRSGERRSPNCRAPLVNRHVLGFVLRCPF